jgi:predicted ATPase/class 3 adenylate cyclase
MQASPRIVTFLFTDIEGSTRLWEQQPERMQPALAHHDAIARSAVERNRGVVVKMTGDGIHAAFDDPLDAVGATLQLQQALADPGATEGIALRIRCGLHAGVDERRDDDFFGRSVNRAARIMSAAHGGQILASEAVAALIRDRLPEGVTLHDLGCARLRDLASPERIFQIAHPQLQQEFPPLRSLEATPNNLPQQVTSFVGRERQLAEVKKLFAKTRLLTLVGAGGIGKTRLSLQVAADLMDDFPDGVWFVELAPLTDEQRVPQAVASVLGVKEEPTRPMIEALLKHIKNRQALLVLDNCEHLVQACAALAAQSLQAAPQLKVLASSREALRTAGEHVYAVPPLSLPEPREAITAESLTQFEAAQLFLERAVASQPAFEATDRNAAAIADICVRLDGIPLAIELAAARVRALPVDTIATRLSDRFRLLAGGDRTVLPRQQTLQALIDWSYDLLTKPERIVLRRLAVFAGSWALEAAEAVAAGGEVTERDVLDLLSRLVEKSLAVLEASGSRYRLLETIRHYAQERLNEAGEGDAIRDRHLAFYLSLAESAGPKLVGPEQALWLARLDRERENLLLAHAWCDRAHDGAEIGLRLVHAVTRYWLNRGLLQLGEQLTMEALARPGAQAPSLSRCRSLFDAGQLECWMGHYAEAMPYLEESLEVARALGDRARIAMVLQPLGMASLAQGTLYAAQAYLEEALSLAQELGDKRELAAALNGLAQVHRLNGDLDRAEPLYTRAVALARELNDRESIAIGLLNLAMVSISRGSAHLARGMLLEASMIAMEIGSKPVGQSVLDVAAGLAASCKDWERAARLFGAVEAQTTRTGIRRDPADESFLAPLMENARQTLAPTLFTQLEAAGRALAYEDAMEDVRRWLERTS